jgi:hypothetical protein
MYAKIQCSEQFLTKYDRKLTKEIENRNLQIKMGIKRSLQNHQSERDEAVSKMMNLVGKQEKEVEEENLDKGDCLK